MRRLRMSVPDSPRRQLLTLRAVSDQPSLPALDSGASDDDISVVVFIISDAKFSSLLHRMIFILASFSIALLCVGQ